MGREAPKYSLLSWAFKERKEKGKRARKERARGAPCQSCAQTPPGLQPAGGKRLPGAIVILTECSSPWVNPGPPRGVGSGSHSQSRARTDTHVPGTGWDIFLSVPVISSFSSFFIEGAKHRKRNYGIADFKGFLVENACNLISSIF